MKPHIYLFLVATFCSASLIAEPQPFSAVTLTDQEIETARLRMKVLRCSVTNNPKRYSGPIELQVSRSEKGVVVKYPPKTAKEFRNCVGGNPEKSDGVKAWFTETFPFHPWAGR